MTLAILGSQVCFTADFKVDRCSDDQSECHHRTLGFTIDTRLHVVERRENVDSGFGNFVNLDQEHYHFHIKFVFDRLSIPLVIMSYVLVGVIGAFANVYLHRESGYHRFFVLFSMFLVRLLFAFFSRNH